MQGLDHQGGRALWGKNSFEEARILLELHLSEEGP